MSADDADVAAQERVGHVAHRRQDSSQLEEAPLQLEQLDQPAAVGVAGEHPILEGVDAIREAIELREVAVDGRIEHEIDEGIDRIGEAGAAVGESRRSAASTIGIGPNWTLSTQRSAKKRCISERRVVSSGTAS